MQLKAFTLAALLAVPTIAGCASGALDEDEILYTAVGASDAVGIGAVPLTRGYVFEIANELDARGKDVELINLGIPGGEASTLNRTTRTFFRGDFEPALVTVWLGGNDLIAGVPADRFEADLREIMERIDDETDAFVVIANLPDMTELPRFIAEPDADVTTERVSAYNAVIAEVAADYDARLVDLFAQGVEPDLVSSIDGFHPSNEGHRRIAELFLDVILPEI